jgi:hypothetical protein
VAAWAYTPGTVCMQCMMGAMTAGAAATGARAWLAARRPRWVPPGRLRAITAALITAGVIAAGALLS